MKKISFSRKHFLKSLLTILIGAFIAWVFDVVNYQQVEKSPSIKLEQNLTILSGIAYASDGDSIEINKNKRIRLLEVDAPEYLQTCLDKNGAEYSCGKMSAYFLRKLVNGKEITCKSPAKDVYNRYLAFCYLDEININHEILKNGMAIIYDLNQASDEAIELEEQARKAKIGIWQGGFLEPKEYRKRNKR